MADTVARQTTSAENPLCGRLKAKYGYRIASAYAASQKEQVKVHAPQSKTAKAIRQTVNLYSETAEFVPAKAKANVKINKSVKSNSVAWDSAAAAKRRTAAYAKETPFKSGAYSYCYKRAADIRARAYDGSEAVKSKERRAARKKTKRAPILFSIAWFKQLHLYKKTESEVETAPIPFKAIAGIVLAVAVVLAIILIFSEINTFKREIASLETKKEELCEEYDRITREIDEKTDVRTIEKIATEDIGMVKSNQVVSKYITLSPGDRIENITNENEEEKNDGVFSTLISSFSQRFDDIMDYVG